MEPLADDDPALIAGYRVRARLGAGGMGRVYLAFTAGGRPVAVKVVRPELGEDEHFRVRFRQEVAAAQRVHGMYTAQVLDADPGARPPWLVTAYVPGPSLREAVTRRGPLPEQTVLSLMAGVAEALQAIHAAGIVHRDLKPSNVLLAADGPRVIDFGIARAAEATTVTRTGVPIGTPAFMAPEQAEGRPVSPATDVFALGATVAYAALGRPPFGEGMDAPMLYRIVHHDPDLTGCPPALLHLIRRCLAKRPEDRPGTGEVIAECRRHLIDGTFQPAEWLPPAVAADLTRHTPPMPPPDSGATGTAGQGPSASPPTPPPPAGMVPARSRLPIFAGVGAVILTAGLITAVLIMMNPGGGRAGAGSTLDPSTASTHHTTRSQPAAPATGSTPNSSACLIGTWKAVSEQLSAPMRGEPVLFTASGARTTVNADGTLLTDYGNGTVFSATYNGIPLTETATGTVTAHWAVQNGELLRSDITQNGTVTLRENGTAVATGPLSPAPGTVQFTCSGNTLRAYGPNGNTVYVRQTTTP